MVGSATLTMLASSTIINCALAMTANASPRCAFSVVACAHLPADQSSAGTRRRGDRVASVES
jgi:hypothetical protein